VINVAFSQKWLCSCQRQQSFGLDLHHQIGIYNSLFCDCPVYIWSSIVSNLISDFLVSFVFYNNMFYETSFLFFYIQGSCQVLKKLKEVKCCLTQHNDRVVGFENGTYTKAHMYCSIEFIYLFIFYLFIYMKHTTLENSLQCRRYFGAEH